MPDKKVFLSVTNDVITDQRVHRIAVTLCEFGYDVEVVGRDLGVKFNFNQRPYKIKLLKLPFRKGFLFYAFYNLSLFFYLLFKKANILVSNDLDTLPANYLVSHIRGITLVFDSHEYFPEVPELIDRKFVKNFWIFIEKIFVKRVKYCYIVCDSIDNLYKNKYNAHFEVIGICHFGKQKKDLMMNVLKIRK